jgi:hypothetical protein
VNSSGQAQKGENEISALPKFEIDKSDIHSHCCVSKVDYP